MAAICLSGFHIRAICNPTSFWSFEIQTILDFRSPPLYFCQLKRSLFCRARRRQAKKEHKRQEKIMKEERELAKKKEAELKKSGAEKMKELLVSFFSL